MHTLPQHTPADCAHAHHARGQPCAARQVSAPYLKVTTAACLQMLCDCCNASLRLSFTPEGNPVLLVKGVQSYEQLAVAACLQLPCGFRNASLRLSSRPGATRCCSSSECSHPRLQTAAPEDAPSKVCNTFTGPQPRFAGAGAASVRLQVAGPYKRELTNKADRLRDASGLAMQ